MKTFTYEVSRGVEHIATWSTDVLSEPSFSKEIDSSLSPMTILLPRSFNELGEDVALGNIVKTYCHNDGVSTLIHAGFIEEYEPVLDDTGDTVSVHVVPWVTQLANDYFKDSATVTAKSFTAVDVSTILQYIIDRSIAAAGPFSHVTYTADSIATSGKTASVQLGSERLLDAIARVKRLGWGNWYWYIDASGRFIYRDFDSGTKHVFTKGRDTNRVKKTVSMTTLRNTVYFWNGSDTDTSAVAIERPEAESASQQTYGRRVELLLDSRIDSNGAAESIADRFIQENEAPVTTLEIDVDGSLYGIESIEPGDTCEIRNVPALDGKTFAITQIQYSPDSAILTLADGVARRSRTFGLTMSDAIDRMQKAVDGSIPTSFTN